MMYELFSGTLPFAGPSHGRGDDAPSRRSRRRRSPSVDDELGRIILRALAKTPAGRYQTVRQLREALDRWAKSTAKLEDIVANQVVACAQEARAMKQAALTTPDATAQMPKMDMIEPARATTRQEAGPPRDNNKKSAGPVTENPNSPESVEASLEDFISQANASFPTSDGWDLHTGDVELIDERPGEWSRLRRRRGCVGAEAADRQAAPGRSRAGRREKRWRRKPPRPEFPSSPRPSRIASRRRRARPRRACRPCRRRKSRVRCRRTTRMSVPSSAPVPDETPDRSRTWSATSSSVPIWCRRRFRARRCPGPPTHW